MDWYYYIALAAILSQLLFLVQAIKNYRYTLVKYKKKRSWHQLRTVLIVPCKGLDSAFHKNITSLFNQDYENYLLWFVVAEKSDPAYDQLCKLKNQLSQNSKAHEIQIFLAGKVGDSEKQSADNEQPTTRYACSQKIHNLLYCYERIGKDIDALAFADSDICVRTDWLSHLVWHLRLSKTGATTGYRLFIPERNNLATLALSAVNAKIAQLLGNTRFNQAWGGSMAIRVDTFQKIGLDKIWPKTISDDLSLSHAVKKAGKKVEFVPACLVASYESTTWQGLFEFARRQFVITRVSAPLTWWFGLISTLYSILGLWAGSVLAIYAVFKSSISGYKLSILVAVPILFFSEQLSSTILRQKMICKVLQKDWPKLKLACAVDILFFWAWSLLLLFLIISSSLGRTICWRGIRYKLLGPTETILQGPQT
ncbi:MAG: glycosyltransferase family 2 protein [Planctomycetota bacterium]|jgi:cellulose synthase/poly-beta-1,6-N-acetylglucosamine synthase-like glycosyltransferase